MKTPSTKTSRDAASPRSHLAGPRSFGGPPATTPRPPHRLRHSLAALEARPEASALPGHAVIQAKFEAAKFHAAIGGGNYADAAKHLKGADDEERAAALQQAGGQHLRPLFEASTHLGTQLKLFEPLQRHEARERYLADQNAGQLDILEGARLDAEASLEDLQRRQGQMSVFTLDSTKRQQVRALDQLKTRARGLEQQHGISLRSTAATRHRPEDPRGFREFSGDELTTIDSVLNRLPTAHVRDNPELRFLSREQSPEQDHEDDQTGAAYQTGDQGVHVYDVAHQGAYRGVGLRSVLGQHGAGREVTPLEDVLTHEIGHSVHAHKAPEFQAFQQHAGWEAYADQGGLTQALTAGGKTQEEALQIAQQMDQERAQPFHQRTQQLHGGYHYVVDPDNAGRFFRRRDNSIPGDAATPQSEQHDLMAYAKTSPKEHFAEMYSQMVHVPERVYADYVTGPEHRYQQADAAYQAEHEADVVDEARLAELGTQRQERARQRDAMRGQWDVMRRDVFGVDQALVDQHAQQIRARAHGKPAHEIDAFERRFRTRARSAATPRQLGVLRDRHYAEIDAM